MNIATQTVHKTVYGKGKEIETMYSEEGLYLRAFIGKGKKEVCYKTKNGDIDLCAFAKKLGWKN